MMVRRSAWMTGAVVVGLLLAACGSKGANEQADRSVRSTTSTTGSTTVPSSSSTTSSTSTTTTAPPTTTTVAPTTTAPPRLAPGWDELKDAAIPALCDHPPTTLVDGKDVTLGEHDGFLQLNRTLANGQPGMATLPSNDAGPLTAVVLSCNAGGVGWPDSIAFFGSGGQFYGYHDLFTDIDWEAQGMAGPARDGVSTLSVEGSTLRVYTAALSPTDAECCASTSASVDLQAGNGAIVAISVQEDIGD